MVQLSILGTRAWSPTVHPFSDLTVDDLTRQLSERFAFAKFRPGQEEVIRAVLVTHLHGNAPQVSVESGRKMVPSEHMPTFQELEEAVQTVDR